MAESLLKGTAPHIVWRSNLAPVLGLAWPMPMNVRPPYPICPEQSPFCHAILITLATKTPIMAVASSGADDPAAMNVAPATSGDRFITATQETGG